MSDKFKKVTVMNHGIVVNLRDNTEVDIIIDSESGTVYVPAYTPVDGNTDAPPEKPAKKEVAAKAKAKKAAEEEIDEPEEVEEKTPAKKAATKSRSKKVEKEEAKGEMTPEELSESVQDVLGKADEGDLTPAEAVAEIVALTGGDKKAATKIVKTFLDNPDSDFEETAKELIGGEEEEEEKTPAKKARGAKKPAEELVEAADLKKGDNVEVYFGTIPEDDDNEEAEVNEWFEGVVISTKKGIPTFRWTEDETEAEYDEEYMDKIKMA